MARPRRPTQGRTEMGIGAGWYEHEWRAYGYGFPTAGDRIGMSYAILNFPEVAYDRTALTLFTEKVAPALTS